MHRHSFLLSALVVVPPLCAQQQQFLPDQGRLSGSFIPGLNAPSGFAVGDVDGDLDADVAVLTSGGLRICLREPAGWTVVGAVPASSAQSLRFRDLDNDGDLDLLSAPRDALHAGTATIFTNQGNGVFTASQPFGSTQVRHVTIGDADGDGDLDLVMSALSTLVPSIQLFRNNGGMAFQVDAPAIPTGLPSGCAAEFIDLDNDGDLDLLASCISAGAVYLRNTGGVFASAPAALPAMTLGHLGCDVGDFDGDGRTDAALVWWNGDLDVLWGAVGTPVFQAAVAAGLSAVYTNEADTDGDGDADLVVSRADGCDLLTNLGARQFQRSTLVRFAPALAGDGLGDLNGDGRADLLVAGTGTDLRARCFFGSTTMVEDAAAARGFLRFSGFLRQTPMAGDIDGDGRVDVLLGSSTVTDVHHGLGGNVWLTTTTAPGASSTTVERRRLVDLDGDGDRDLLIETLGTMTGFRNNGNGVFQSMFTYTDGGNSGYDPIAIGDVDGDGDADVVGARSAGAVLYRNAPGGLQAGVVVLASPGTNLPNCVELADLDGDGDLDLVTDVTAPGGGHKLLRNDGTGTFAPFAGFTANLGILPLSIASGDADGDGDVDLVVRDFHVQMVRLLRNDGSGAFTEVVGAMPAMLGGGGNALLFADLDDDGDRDVFLLSLTGPDGPRLLVNDGSGQFTDATASRWAIPPPLSSTYAWDVVAADFDDDGDLDIAESGPDGMGIAYNHTRQLYVRQSPRIGTTASIDTWVGAGYGPGAGSLLFASFGQRATPLAIPGIKGLLELDSSAVSLGFQPVVAPGIATTSLTIPNVGAFVGIRLWFQSLVLPQTVGAVGFSTAMGENILP